jgi:hypothetical protein
MQAPKANIRPLDLFFIYLECPCKLKTPCIFIDRKENDDEYT